MREGRVSVPERLLTVKEYAALFHLTEQAVYTAIRMGRFPHPVERPLGVTGAYRIHFVQKDINLSVDSPPRES